MNETMRMEAIIEEHQEQLFRFAYYRTGSVEEAQDVVQNIFVRLLEKKVNLEEVDNLKAYLFRAVANGCTDVFRRRGRESTVIDSGELLLESDSQTSQGIEQQEYEQEQQRIESLLRELPGPQSEVIRLRTVVGLTFVEIAKVLEIPETTAKSRFKYGIDKLREQLNLKNVVL